MTHSPLLSGALLALVLSVTLAGQTANRSAGTDLPAGPLAISGMASSARHCVSGDAANVHGIGWVETGTSYTVTFDSEIALVTGVSRLNLGGNAATSAFGTPELRFTASTPGSMALYVGGRGQAGCYRYKVEIQQASPSVAAAAGSRRPSAIELVKPPKYPVRTMAISGAASSARHCVTGNAAKIHGLGRVEQGADIRITFDSDFDPIAGVTLLNFNPERGTYLVDDDTGGDLEPSLHFTASQSGTLALHVGSVGGRAGCYRYQVQIQSGSAPAPSPTPAPTFAQFNGSWSGTFTGQSSGTLAFTIANATITVTQPAQGDGTINLGFLEAEGVFHTRGPEGSCTWTGPFLPGGARQSSASGLWSCGNGRSGAWSAARGTTPAPPTPAPPTPPPTPPPTGGGNTTTFVSSPGITCLGRGNGPVQGTCSGQITIRVGQTLPAGTVVWVMVQAQAFLFGSATATTPGQVTVTVQGQIQMFDFDDNIVCPRSVTQVVVTRDSRQGASLGNPTGFTIPVTCRRG